MSDLLNNLYLVCLYMPLVTMYNVYECIWRCMQVDLAPFHYKLTVLPVWLFVLKLGEYVILSSCA